MIKRLLSTKLAAFLKLFPVVAVVGPRQAGKTTFVKNELRQWRYFDLEKPSDYNKLRPDVEYFFQEYGKHCIVDEVQEIPAIFSYLRSFIDSNRRKKGQIVLLGSVNPLLLKEISESLTGRIGLIELSTLTYSEIHNNVKMNLEDFWLNPSSAVGRQISSSINHCDFEKSELSSEASFCRCKFSSVNLIN